MQEDTQRQCISADLEIKVIYFQLSFPAPLNTSLIISHALSSMKLRNIYFDRVEPKAVTDMIADIYRHVDALQDIQFLVKYATQLLPAKPEEVNGPAVWSSIVDLQSKLTRKREVGAEPTSDPQRVTWILISQLCPALLCRYL